MVHYQTTVHCSGMFLVCFPPAHSQPYKNKWHLILEHSPPASPCPCLSQEGCYTQYLHRKRSYEINHKMYAVSLRMHLGSSPDHCPLDWQILSPCPLSLYPGRQEYLALDPTVLPLVETLPPSILERALHTTPIKK